MSPEKRQEARPGVFSRIGRNVLSTSGATILTRLIGFAATIYLTRVLGPTFYGKYGLAYSIFLLVSNIGDLGLGIHASREIARAGDSEQGRLVRRRLAGRVLLVRTAVSLVGLLVPVLLASRFGADGDMATLFILFGASIVLFALNPEWVFVGLQRIFPVALTHVLRDLAFLGLVVAFIHGPGDVAVTGVAFFAVMLLRDLVLHVWLRLGLGFGMKLEIDIARSWRDVVAALPLGYNTLAILVYYEIDTVLLGLLLTSEHVGVYRAAYRFVYFFLAFMAVAQYVFLPALSGVAGRDARRFSSISRDASRLFGIYGFGIMLLGALFAHDMIRLVYGAEYLGGVIPLAILSGSVLAGFLGLAASTSLLAGGFFWDVAVATSIGGIANIVLNLILIPRHELVGAAAATLATEILVAVVCLARAWKRYGRPFDHLHLVPFLPAVLAALVTWMFLPDVHLAVRVLVAGGLYLAGLVAVRSVRASDVGLLSRVRSDQS